ncbi:MAG: hypothetical protein KDA37_15815, partial [Planctomycetales bacterium]|nr:hypothetical protein [Planctomycetales bacterium]
MSHPLANRISQLTREARRVALWQGVGWVAAASLGVALVLMLSDYVMRLSDPGMRWLSWALLLIAVAAAAVRWLGGREWRKITQLSTAQRVQSLRPGLGSRLASSVEFLNQHVEDPTAGSADLRRRVVAETTAEIEQMELTDVVDRRALHRAIQALACGAAVVAVFGLADPAGLRTSAARLAAPWSDQNWPRRNHLAVVDPPDRIARGQSFEVELIDQQGVALPNDLRVQYRTRVGGRTRTEEQQAPAATDSVMLRRENIQQSFAFRVLGGDDQAMPWRSVEVVDAPQLSSMTVTARPQAYTGIAPRELREDDRVIAGAEITIDAVAGADLASATLEVTVGDQKQEVASEVSSADFGGGDGVKLKHTWNAAHQGDEPVAASYRLRLTDREGLVGYSKSRTLRIEPDAVPTVEWIEPSAELLVTSQAVAPLRVLMEDNLAIAKAELVWLRPQDPATEEAEPPQPERARIYQGPATPPQRNLPPGAAPLDSREQR